MWEEEKTSREFSFHVIWYLLATQFQYAYTYMLVCIQILFLEEYEWNVRINIYNTYENMVQLTGVYSLYRAHIYSAHTTHTYSVCKIWWWKEKKKPRWRPIECTRKIFHLKFRRKNDHNSIMEKCLNVCDFNGNSFFFCQFDPRSNNKTLESFNWFCDSKSMIEKKNKDNKNEIKLKLNERSWNAHFIKCVEKWNNFVYIYISLVLTD